MSIKAFFTQFDENIKKIDQRVRNENYKDLDNTSKNLNDLRTLLNSCQKIVKVYLIISLKMWKRKCKHCPLIKEENILLE
jgi:hypothetical protein